MESVVMIMAKNEKVNESRKKRSKEKSSKDLKKLEKMVEYPFETIKFVLMTEKAIQMIETQNKLIFIVDRKANKKQIKEAVESAFESPVSKVQTAIDQKGRKRAYVKFAKPGAAGDIAVRLGIL